MSQWGPVPRVLAAAALAVAATALPAHGGENACELLSPADFGSVGVPGTSATDGVTDEYGGVFCVYAGKSAGTGGVELDVFPRTTPAEDARLWGNVANFTNASELPAGSVPGAEAVTLSLSAATPAYAAIAVRTPRLVFTLGIPPAPGADKALVELSRRVIERYAAQQR